ncbi:MAG: porin [Burkholderiales bacterium]|jgi:GBP family porin|nr:porin [Burkholderiales bacterium]
MKKSLLALAVLGALAGSASAQSSVTMYGWLDVGYQWNKQGYDAGTVNGQRVIRDGSVSGVQGGYWNGNRWGVRGSEKISDGLNAIFQLEMGFDIDTGTLAQGGRIFGRQAYAGLSSNWGSLVAGRLATFSSGTGAFDMFGSIDPFETGWGINGLGSTFISANALRVDNALAYVSPTWAGFKLGGAYSWNINTQETAPNSTNTTATALGASFSGLGGLYVAVTYDIVGNPSSGTSAQVGKPDQKHLQIGATYDFKIVKVAAAYADQTAISTLNTGNVGGSLLPIPDAIGNYDNTAWMLGLTVPILGNKFGSIRASYQYSDAKNIQRQAANGVLVGWEPDYYVWGIGWGYDLSNRTRVYLGYGQRAYDGNVSNVPGQTAQNINNVIDRDQFAVGLNHRF